MHNSWWWFTPAQLTSKPVNPKTTTKGICLHPSRLFKCLSCVSMFPNQVPEDHKKEKEKKTAASKDTAQKEK